MQDRLSLPESLEKALEHARTEPGDYELSREKAQHWQEIQARGRRSVLMSRVWKPLTGLTLGAAVAAALLLMPHPPEKQTGAFHSAAPQTLSSSQQMQQALLDREKQAFEARIAKYAEQGKKVLFPELNLGGVDVVEDIEANAKGLRAAYAVKDGKQVKIADVPPEKDLNLSVFMNTPPLISFTIKTTTSMSDNAVLLYMLNTEQMQVKNLHLNGQFTGSKMTVWNDPQHGKLGLVFDAYETQSSQQIIQFFDWNSGELKELNRTRDHFVEDIRAMGSDVLLSSPYQLLDLNDQGLQTIEQSEERMFSVTEFGGSNARYVMYQVGSGNQSYTPYRGNAAMWIYDTDTHQKRRLLPNVPGDQLVLLTPAEDQYLVSSFVALPGQTVNPDDTGALKGTLSIWKVGIDGSHPTQLFQKQMTWEEHYLLISPEFDEQHNVKKNLDLVPMTKRRATWYLQYDQEKGTVQDIESSPPQ